MAQYKPITLVVLDGWGESKDSRGNPVLHAKLPTIEYLNQNYPRINLQASGIAVGLPWLQYGNSEVGHQVMGTGQITFQSLPRISSSIGDGSFFKNEVLLQTFKHVKENKSKLHLMGLVSDGGVHSHIDHLFALMELSRWEGLSNQTFIHAFTDGRDTPTHSGEEFLTRVQAATGGNIATVMGRFYAMDRNNNWDRIQLAYDAMVNGKGIQATNPLTAIRDQYNEDSGDEYIKPIVVTHANGQPKALIQDNDAIIFFNYRPDRARQLTKSFVLKDFKEFPVKKFNNLDFTAFGEYEKGLPIKLAFPPQEITERLSRILADHNLSQLKIAETEKYAHVTYFFNGGIEKPFPQEDQVLIPSKNVQNYAELPEMSAYEVTKTLLDTLKQKDYDFILLNFANPDMVGHTGDFDAGVRALEVVDECLKKVIKAILAKKGCLLITADHGNVEHMINLKTGEIDTEHSNEPVPCWLVTPDNKGSRGEQCPLGTTPQGMLLDVPATILDLFEIKKSPKMLGMSLLKILK